MSVGASQISRYVKAAYLFSDKILFYLRGSFRHILLLDIFMSFAQLFFEVVSCRQERLRISQAPKHAPKTKYAWC